MCATYRHASVPMGQADWHGAPTSGLHTNASHFFSTMCRSYSDRKYRSVLSTGFDAVCPRPHMLVSLTTAASSSSSATWSNVPRPDAMSSRISHIRCVPFRQLKHLPQDSSLRNSMKYLATSTMHVRSSMTIMPPEPMIDPARLRLS